MYSSTVLVVTEVVSDSVAENGGVSTGDLVVSVDGNVVTKNYGLSGALSDGGNEVRVFSASGIVDLTLDGQRLGVVTEEHESDTVDILKQPGAKSEFERAAKGYVDNVLLSTTPDFPNKKIVEVKGIVTAEAVLGINALRDLLITMRDTFGGRSKTSENALKALKTHALEELKVEASRMGANAVVAVDLDYSEMSGNQMLFLVASGTAVALSD